MAIMIRHQRGLGLITSSNFYIPQVNLPGSMASFVLPAGIPASLAQPAAVRKSSGSGLGQTSADVPFWCTSKLTSWINPSACTPPPPGGQPPGAPQTQTQMVQWTPDQAAAAGWTATQQQNQAFFNQLASEMPATGNLFGPGTTWSNFLSSIGLSPSPTGVPTISSQTWLIIAAIALGGLFVIGKVMR